VSREVHGSFSGGRGGQRRGGSGEELWEGKREGYFSAMKKLFFFLMPCNKLLSREVRAE